MPTKAVVVVPVVRTSGAGRAAPQQQVVRTADARLEEASGLALAIDLEIVATAIVPVQSVTPATLIGSGKVEELAGTVAAAGAGLVIVDHTLSPVQQRNLEKAWNAKVLDRTGLILEIFGRRARTKEGALQVELAHLNYQKGRLVRSWTHLERQRGGAGFLGGPGETQIEADRRILQDKIVRLERELETVRRTRELHRSKRRKVPYPVVALVGYTNAGKSTLFNRLTGADVLAEDMLFATLDPTLRRLRLPSGAVAILSDTVGFISDLPTHLVAAFRATLEEVVEARLVVHVRDIADPFTNEQAKDVEAILADLGIEAGDEDRVLEVWNKIDLLRSDATPGSGMDDESGLTTVSAPSISPDALPVSAMTGEGIDALLEAIDRRISGELRRQKVVVPAGRMGVSSWLYENASVRSRKDRSDGSVEFDVTLTEAASEQLKARLAQDN